MPKFSKQDKEHAFTDLRAWFPKGSTVYTILRHVSQSGLSRNIGVVAIDDQNTIYHPNWATAAVLDLPIATDAVKVRGCGMDMGFHLAYSLSLALYGDGSALEHRWL